jgi:hypothetical protein
MHCYTALNLWFQRCTFSKVSAAITAMVVCSGYACHSPEGSCGLRAQLRADTKSALAAGTQSLVPSGYHLTFDDEFKVLNLSDTENPGARWYTHTIQCCMQDTLHPSTPTYMNGVSDPPGEQPYSLVAGGGLDIRLQKSGGAWHSGVIATVNRQGQGFSQEYGYFEMEAQFPSGVGCWPAFWLLNADALQRGAPAGEIDIVESYMFAPDYINTTLHDWTPPPARVGYKLSKVSDLAKGFHVFAMLWTAATMTFYCDGMTLYTLPTPPIMHQPYYPIVDLGLGGGWPTKDTPQQNDMIVKYVRVYAPDK